MLNRIPESSPPSFGAPGSGEHVQDPFGRDVDVQRLWKAVVRRRKLFLWVFGGFFLLVCLFTLLQPRSFTTAVKLIAGSSGQGGPVEQGGTQLPVLNALLEASSAQSSETYAELLQQTPVAAEVSQNLGLGLAPEQLLSHLKVKPVPDTSILTLAISWRDPQTSARIANEFASVFVEHERQLVARQADTAIKFLQQQLPASEEHMRAAQDALATYEVRAGIADLQTQTKTDIDSITALDQKRQAAELEATQAAASLETVEAQLAQTSPTVVGSQSLAANPVNAQLQSQISSLRVQLNAARQQYTDDHPTVIALKSQLAEAQRELHSQPDQVLAGTSTIPNPVYQQLEQQAASLQAQIASAQAQQDTLAQQQAAAKPKLDQLPEKARRIGDLERSAKAAQDIYDELQRKYQDALISKTTAISDIAITQAADPASYTVTPNVPLNLLIGFGLGLILAVASVFVAEFLDDRFRTEDDIRERLGMPVLATIPHFDAAEWGENPWVKPLSVEAFYQLVAALRYSSNDPPRTIVFTSPDQGDGKSTVALNTAISIAMMKARVLLVDGDLRRPSLHEKLNVPNERGLSDVLVGLASFSDAIRPTEHANVWVLTSGKTAPNPVALLQSPEFDDILRQARERFEYVIVDGPALRSIVDGLILSIKADGAVLVVSSQKSDGRAVAAALQKLHSVGSINLLGVVLNGTKPDPRENSNYYLGAGQSISLPTKTTGS
ncbi:MAG: polysaccharide biosynthesis tyrosine autokinase [Candidatus Baltobacteraceae bacterium]|jgi:capsular exopolysaccharide synthesis family protein